MIFLDTNIILELILPGRKATSKVKKLLQSMQDPTAISTLSIHLIMHFGRQAKIPDSTLHKVIKSNSIISLESSDYKWAIENEQMKDFEDALQMATATRSECETFVTLDKSLSRAYKSMPINILNP